MFFAIFYISQKKCTGWVHSGKQAYSTSVFILQQKTKHAIFTLAKQAEGMSKEREGERERETLAALGIFLSHAGNGC